MRVGWVRAAAAALGLIAVLIGIGVVVGAPGYAAPLGSNQESAFDYFVSQGLPPAAAAGLVGNLDYESAGVNPAASQCGWDEEAPPASYCGVGIAQWTWGQDSETTRWEDLVGLANIEGETGVTFGTTDPNDFPSLSVQEQFVWQELNTTYRSVLGQIEGCAGQRPVLSAIQCATYAVQRGYEAPQNYTDGDPNPGCVTPPGFCDRYADAVAVFETYATPAEPLGLEVRAANSRAVALSWLPASRAAGYEVLRNGVVVGATTGTTFVDAGVDPGTSYRYAVESTSATGVSDPAPAVAATTAPPAPSVSASPSALTDAGGVVTLGLSAAGATSFNYAYALSPGAVPIRGWSPGTRLIGRSAGLHLGIPANPSTQPETYSILATATNAGGTSYSGGITITVGGRRASLARTSKRSRRARTARHTERSS